MKKLLKYADKLLASFNIGGRALTAEDVLSDLVTKIALRERSWDPETEPDLFTALPALMRSYVYNLHKKDSRSSKPMFFGVPDDIYEEMYAEYVDEFALIRNDYISDQENYEEAVEVCMSVLTNEEECMLVFCCIKEGQSRKEIASDLSISLQKVNGLINRTKRKLQGTILDPWHRQYNRRKRR